MSKKIITITLDPEKDIAKVPAGAIPRGVVAEGDNIKAIYEVEELAPLKAVEFLYPETDVPVDLDGFQFVGATTFRDGEVVVSVYSREM